LIKLEEARNNNRELELKLMKDKPEVSKKSKELINKMKYIPIHNRLDEIEKKKANKMKSIRRSVDIDMMQRHSMKLGDPSKAVKLKDSINFYESEAQKKKI